VKTAGHWQAGAMYLIRSDRRTGLATTGQTQEARASLTDLVISAQVCDLATELDTSHCGTYGTYITRVQFMKQSFIRSQDWE